MTLPDIIRYGVVAVTASVITSGGLVALYSGSSGFRNFCGRTLGKVNNEGLIEENQKIQDVCQSVLGSTDVLNETGQRVERAVDTLKVATSVRREAVVELAVANESIATLNQNVTDLIRALESNCEGYKRRVTQLSADVRGYQGLLAKSQENCEELRKLLDASRIDQNTQKKTKPPKFFRAVLEKINIKKGGPNVRGGITV